MKILTIEEIRRVAEAVQTGSGSFADDGQILGAVEWAKQARVQADLLDGILQGKYVIDLRGGGLCLDQRALAADEEQSGME